MNRSKGTAHELGLGQDVGISVARREECSHRASHMCEQYEQLLTKLTTMSSLSPGWDVYIGLRRPEACSYMSYMFNMSNMFVIIGAKPCKDCSAKTQYICHVSKAFDSLYSLTA